MISQHIMTDPLSLGTQYQLGNHRTTCKPPTIGSRILSCIYVSIMICIMTIIMFGIGLLVPSIPELRSYLYFGILFASVPLLMIFELIDGIYIAIRYGTLRVFVYDNGLISVSQKSLKVISWQNVEALCLNVVKKYIPCEPYSFDKYVYTVNCTDGTKLTFNENLRNIEQIWQIIEEETARYLFPTALNTYRMGQAVVFGPLTVTQEGLSRGANMLPWTEIRTLCASSLDGKSG